MFFINFFMLFRVDLWVCNEISITRFSTEDKKIAHPWIVTILRITNTHFLNSYSLLPIP